MTPWGVVERTLFRAAPATRLGLVRIAVGLYAVVYLGMRVGQQVLGLKDGRTAFDDLPFETRPLYAGAPWFVPPMVMVYRLRDRLGL